ncbi:MAG: hypothetical protein AAF433_14475 [Bacteroidota bacterium]
MQRLPWLLLVLSLIGAATGRAQNCGRADTVSLDAQSVTLYEIDVTDFVNNDLADPAQGVCGFELTFAHQYIYDVTITLTSPGGQSVELIGPFNNQNRPPTIFTRWFIDFSQCADPTAPDPGASAQWNNNNAFDWVAGATYQGTYHPSNGCLEDFNLGPVNGSWTLTVNSTRAGAAGAIVFARIIFCDEAGLDCCFAEAGTLLEPAIVRCVNHPDLDLDPVPFYPVPRPDSSEYGYTYLIFDDSGLLIQRDSLADLTDLPSGQYQMCGLSYLLSDDPLLPTPDGNLTRADIDIDLADFFPSFCGDLSTECQFLTILDPPDTTIIQRTICNGGVVNISGQAFSSTGVFDVDLIGEGLCDSIVRLELDVVDEFFSTVDTTLCATETITIGNTYNSTGTFIDTIPSMLGCDSIVTLNLFVRDPLITDTTLVLCQGESFSIGSEVFSSSIVTSRTITSPSTGCDSVIFLDLTVLDPQIVLAPYDPIDCINEGILLDASGSVFTQAPNYSWLDSTGLVQLGTDPSLTVTQAGDYILEISEIRGGVTCTARDTFSVVDIRETPMLDMGLPDTLTCTREFVTIGGPGSSLGPEFTYSWTGQVGAIFTQDTDRIVTQVATPGPFQLLITNTSNGCQDSATIQVFQDTITPDATISGAGLLNCYTPIRVLSADTLQANNDEHTYMWTATCNPIFGTEPTFDAVCDGLYGLFVTNERTGCVGSTTIRIFEDFRTPNATLGPAEVLTCDFPEQFLDGSGSSGFNFIEYFWTSAGVAVGTNNDSLLITQGGPYQLLVQDTVSGCVDSANITVLVDQDFPQADAGPDTTSLNCYNPTLTIGGPGSSMGPDFTYSWITFAEPSDTISTNPNVLVEPPAGLYILAVRDETNGCTTRDSSRIFLELDTPFVRFDPVLEFGCFTDSVTIDAGQTNLSFDFDLNWSGPCVPDDNDTTAINVFCPGIYELSVFNIDNGCESSRSIEVGLAPNAIVAVLPDSAIIDCETGIATLDNSLSSPTTVRQWLRDGEPVSLFPPNNPTVTVPGTYTYIISNFDGSCTDTATIEVTVDCPILTIIVPPDSLTCDRAQVILDASFSLPAAGPGVTTEWLFDNPICVQPQPDPRQLGVACPGIYGFVINNPAFGLSDTLFVEVTQDIAAPIVEAGPSDTLTCNQPLILLDGSASEQDPRYDFSWTSGGIDTVGTGLTATINEPGVYLLQVRNRETGCEAADAVTVFRNIEVPDLSFSDVLIPCREDSFAISVTASPEGDYLYNWSGPLIQSGQDSSTMLAGEEGTYIATVINQENGCPTSADVDLFQLPCPPCLELPDTVLTCTNPTVDLALDFCEPCQGCTFSWSLNGNLLPGETASNLIVSEPGLYTVRAVNQFTLSSSLSVTVTDLQVLPASAAGPDRFLTCDSSAVWLGTTVQDSVFDFTFQWLREDDSLIAGADSSYIRTDIAGLYQLVVTNPLSDCVAIDTVILAYDTLPPTVEAGPPRILTCDDPLRVLDGIGSSTGSAFSYNWTGGPAATCLEGIATLSPIVACSGTYYLEILDQRNGCRAIDSVLVTAEDALPAIIPMADTNLTCLTDSIDLVPIIADPALLPTWCPLDGVGQPIVAECVNDPTFLIGDPGDYRFELFNAATGCSNGFVVSVGTDFAFPTAEAGPSDTLYCTLDSLALGGEGLTVSGLPPVYSWSSLNGFPIGQANQDTAYAFAPDRYFLSITDPLNGCTTVDSVDLFRDLEAPTAFAGNDTTLNCRMPQISLVGEGTSLSGQVSFEWSTIDGQIVANEATLTPLVDAPGTYLFAVTDAINNCTAFDVVLVGADILPPIAQIDPPTDLLINCFQPEIVVDASSSSAQTGNGIDFGWATLGVGTPIGTVMSDAVLIDAAGSYQLYLEDQGNGCRDTLNFEVSGNFSTPSLLLPTPELVTCGRPEVVLSTNANSDDPYNFIWRNLIGDTLGDQPTVEVNAAGNYEVIVTDTISGCFRLFRTAVADDLEAPTVVLSNPPALGCERIFSPINGGGSSQGNEFMPFWSASGDGAFTETENPYTISASTPGYYSLEILNTRNGCRTQDSVEVIQVALAITSLDFEVEDATCDEDLFGGVMILGQIGGTPPFRYRLDGGLLTDRLVYGDLPLGEHTITVVDSSGCELTQSFAIVNGLPLQVELGPDQTIHIGESVTLNYQTTALAVDTLIWTSEGPIPTPGEAPMTVSPEVDYFYLLTVVDTNGCRATDTIQINVINDIPLYMPTGFSPNGDNTNDRYFPYAGPQVARVRLFRIFDRWGNLVHERTDIPPNDPAYGWDGNFEGRPMNPAAFVWQLEIELVDGERLFRYGDLVLVR